MPGKLIDAQGANFTAPGTADGIITVASTTGFFAKAFGNISDTTGRSDKVQITAIIDATHLGVRIIRPLPAAIGSSGDGSTPVPNAPNYGRSNISAYTNANAARVDQEAQLIYDADNTLQTT